MTRAQVRKRVSADGSHRRGELLSMLRGLSGPDPEDCRAVLADWLDEHFPSTPVVSSEIPAWLHQAILASEAGRRALRTHWGMARTARRAAHYALVNDLARDPDYPLRQYMDHDGRTTIAGVECYVSEPYMAPLDAIAGWCRLAELFRGVVAAYCRMAFHNPPACCRLILFPDPGPALEPIGPARSLDLSWADALGDDAAAWAEWRDRPADASAAVGTEMWFRAQLRMSDGGWHFDPIPSPEFFAAPRPPRLIPLRPALPGNEAHRIMPRVVRSVRQGFADVPGRGDQLPDEMYTFWCQRAGVPVVTVFPADRSGRTLHAAAWQAPGGRHIFDAGWSQAEDEIRRLPPDTPPRHRRRCLPWEVPALPRRLFEAALRHTVPDPDPDID